MSTLEVWIIIILIVGVIASNLAALKYSAKFKLPQFGQHSKDKQIKPSTAENDAETASNKPCTTESEANKADEPPKR